MACPHCKKETDMVRLHLVEGVWVDTPENILQDGEVVLPNHPFGGPCTLVDIECMNCEKSILEHMKSQSHRPIRR